VDIGRSQRVLTGEQVSAADLEEIRNVLALYCHVVDNQEWNRIGDVYAPDGSYGARGSEPHEGLEEIVKFLSTVPPMVHTSSNHHIDLSADGKTATGRGKWLVVVPDSRVVAGDYDDLYVKTDAGWRIKGRTSSLRVRSPQA
jgi:hypothetical protein